MFARVVKERITELDKTKTPGRSNSRNSKRRASPSIKQSRHIHCYEDVTIILNDKNIILNSYVIYLPQ